MAQRLPEIFRDHALRDLQPRADLPMGQAIAAAQEQRRPRLGRQPGQRKSQKTKLVAIDDADLRRRRIIGDRGEQHLVTDAMNAMTPLLADEIDRDVAGDPQNERVMIVNRGGIALHPRKPQPGFLKRILGELLRTGPLLQMRAQRLPLPEINRHHVIIGTRCGRCIHAAMRDSGNAGGKPSAVTEKSRPQILIEEPQNRRNVDNLDGF